MFARAPNAAYKTGRIILRSLVRLEIGPTTAVLGSHQLEHWTPRNTSYPSPECALTPDFGTERGVLGGLFYAAMSSGFSIGGGGTVNGAAKAWNKPPANSSGLKRSNMFVFEQCSDVVVEDLQIQDRTIRPMTCQIIYLHHLLSAFIVLTCDLI